MHFQKLAETYVMLLGSRHSDLIYRARTVKLEVQPMLTANAYST